MLHYNALNKTACYLAITTIVMCTVYEGIVTFCLQVNALYLKRGNVYIIILIQGKT